MFGLAKTIFKRTKCETYAREIILKKRNFDIGKISRLRLSQITDELFLELKNYNNIRRKDEEIYTELLEKKLTELKILE